ncbi:MAG: SGNH/GDSL hydrolase family protein [Marmoricola sp.]
MTVVNITVIGPNGFPASGSLTWTPVKISGNPSLPAPQTVALDGTGTESVTLTANDATWVWRVDEAITGVDFNAFYVHVPTTGPVSYKALVRADPVTGKASASVGRSDIPSTATQSAATLNATYAPLAVAQKAMSLAPGLVWAFAGDSITNGSNASNFVYSYSQRAVQLAGGLVARPDFISGGKPGDVSAGLLTRIPTILAAGAQALVVMIGTNDAGTSVPVDTYVANLTAIVSKAKNAGLPVVLCTIAARGSSASATTHQFIDAYNAWIRNFGPSLGCTIADTYSVTVDPATGYMLASIDSGDNTHPNDTGHKLIAGVVAAAMRKAANAATPDGLIRTGGALGIRNMVQDPLAATGTTQPSGWFEWPGGSGTAPTYSLVADTSGVLPAGKWAQMDFDATAAGGTRRLSTNGLNASYWSAGEKLLLTTHVQFEDVSGTWEADVVAGTASMGLGVINQSGVSIYSPLNRPIGRKNSSGFYDLGPLVFPFTVPAGTTGLNIWFTLVLPTGKRVKMRVGATGVLNLTRLGSVNQYNWGNVAVFYNS